MSGDDMVDVAKGLVDGPVKHSIQSAFDAVNRTVESRDPLGRFSRAQKERIKASHQNIKLLGMPEPISLAKIYFPTQVSTTVGRRLYKQEWMEADSAVRPTLPAKNQKAIKPADEFLETHRKIVVLGGPGAGKTTFLKFMALAYADDELRESTALKTPYVPFFVSLPHYVRQKKSGSLFDAIVGPVKDATNSYATDFVKQLLLSGKAAVFLDALDEVPKSIRQGVIDEIKDFEAFYPNASIVLSCRTADYEEVLLNFHEVEVARLSKEAISKIVKAWFGEDKQNARRLLEIIENDDGVASLTATPLLLSLLCIQFRHDLVLPKRKVELYKRCVEALLRDWDTTRGFRRESAYEELSDDRKERLFEHIAGRFFVEQEAYEFRCEEIVPCVASYIEKVGLSTDDAEQVLHEIECHHGIVEKLSQEEYCFSHTSIQDYFVAKHLIAKGVASERVVANLENETWEPVIEFVVALAEDPQAILEQIMKKSAMVNLSNYPPMARRTRLLWLLYRCMASAPFVDRAFAKGAYEHLVQTQIEMARIYRSGGVFPIAELEVGGVRHPFLWRHKRPTLATALQPFRKFANEVLVSPLRGYADEALKVVGSLSASNATAGTDALARDALIISLVAPLASEVPKRVEEVLSEVKERQSNNSYIGSSLDRSIKVLRQHYL